MNKQIEEESKQIIEKESLQEWMRRGLYNA